MSCVVMVPGANKAYDGVSRHIQEISKRLSKKGFLIVNILPSKNRTPDLQIVSDSYVRLEVPVLSFRFLTPRLSLIGSYLNRVLYYFGYKEAVRKIAFDLNDVSILHTHGFCVVTQPKKSRFKRLSTFHGFGQLDVMSRYRSHFRALILHSMLRKVYANADHYTTFSCQMRRTASQLYQINPSQVTLVPHGVDAGFFSAKKDLERIKEMESKFDINKPFRVTFAGHLVGGKGLDIMLRSFKILRRRRNDVMLLLKVGNYASSAVRGLVERSGLNNDVRVISDFLDEVDFRTLYQLSDTFVNFHMLSGYSTTVLEAMASGIPPIIYRNSPNRDIVDESCGLLLESLNPEELADGIEMLADDSGLSRKLGRNAKHRVAKCYDWDQGVVPKYASVYNALIGS